MEASLISMTDIQNEISESCCRTSEKLSADTAKLVSSVVSQMRPVTPLSLVIRTPPKSSGSDYPQVQQNYPMVSNFSPNTPLNFTTTASSVGTPTSMSGMEISESSPKIRNKFIPSDPQQECAVCSGRASGKHFGAYTCESCKLFFLRILKIKNGAGRPLVCANSNQCPVTVNTRSMCRACRFQKCVDAGMAKEKCVYGRNARMINSQNSSNTHGFSIVQSREFKTSTSSTPEEHGFNSTTPAANTYHQTTNFVQQSKKCSSSSTVYPKIRVPVSSIPSVIQAYKVVVPPPSVSSCSSQHSHSSTSSSLFSFNPHKRQISQTQTYQNRYNQIQFQGTSLGTSAPSLSIPIPAPPSLIPSSSAKLIPIPPPPLVIPSKPEEKTSATTTGAIPIPKLIAAYQSEHNAFFSARFARTNSDPENAKTNAAEVFRPHESEKNSPKSDNSDDSGYCQTDSSYEDQNRGCQLSKLAKYPKGAVRILGTRNDEGNHHSGSSSGRGSEDSFSNSSSGDDSPALKLNLKCGENTERATVLLPQIYLQRDVDKDYFPELPQFAEDIFNDPVLTTRFKTTQHEDEVALALIMTKLTPDENIRLENWVELFEEYRKNWLPCLLEQIEQFKSKHIHISLLEFDCQFLLSTYIPKNLSFRPLVTSHNISPEALKPILFGSIFGLNLPVHHFVCKSDVRFPKIVNEMLKVECRVIKTLKLLELSELELALITNYLSLKTFRRHLPLVCATEMRREESFMDNIFITVMEVNKRERVVRAIHLVCEFTLAKSDVFFKFLQSGTNEIC